MRRPLLPLGFKRTAPKLALGNMELHPLHGRSKEKWIDQPVKHNKNSSYFTPLSLLSWDFCMNRRGQAHLKVCAHKGPQDAFFAAFFYVHEHYVSVVTSVTANIALCVFPESTHWRLVSLVCQQKISKCVSLKMRPYVFPRLRCVHVWLYLKYLSVT